MIFPWPWPQSSHSIVCINPNSASPLKCRANHLSASHLAKLGSERPFVGPEPACSIWMGVATNAVRDWAIRDHRKHWNSLSGLKQAKALLQGPSASKTRELNRHQLLGGRTAHRTMSPNWVWLQSQVWNVPRERRISHTYPMWLFKISSPGSLLQGT
jgi:hypothetical protein